MNILVVDDELTVLESLRRVFSSFGAPTWNTIYASSGPSGLDVLATQPIDIVISDMRMPGMDGGTFLGIAAERWPNITRFALSGEANQVQALRAAGGVVHQFLGKPCPPKTLMAAIAEIDRLGLDDEGAAIREIVGAVPRLPAIPWVFTALRSSLADSGGHTRAISDVIRMDPGIAAKVLQLANSSFFFRGSVTADVQAAVARLGVSLLSRLVLVDGLMTGIVSDLGYVAEVRRFFRASMIAEAAVSGTHRDAAALAVLLCPIGRALLLAADPAKVALAASIQDIERIDLPDAERRVFGTTHAAVGGHLIALWGLPADVSSAVRLQYRPDLLRAEHPVHAATLLANRDIRGLVLDPGPELAIDWNHHRTRMGPE